MQSEIYKSELSDRSSDRVSNVDTISQETRNLEDQTSRQINVESQNLGQMLIENMAFQAKKENKKEEELRNEISIFNENKYQTA